MMFFSYEKSIPAIFGAMINSERVFKTRSLGCPGEMVYSIGYDPGIVFKVKIWDRGTEQTQTMQMPPKREAGQNKTYPGLRLRGKAKWPNSRRKPDHDFVNFNVDVQKNRK